MPKSSITTTSRLSPRELSALNFSQLNIVGGASLLFARKANEKISSASQTLNKFQSTVSVTQENDDPSLASVYEVNRDGQDSKKVAVTAAAVDLTTAKRKTAGLMLLGDLAGELASKKNDFDEIIIPLAEGRGIRDHWVTLHVKLNADKKIESATLYDSKSRFANTRYSKKPIIEMLKELDGNFNEAQFKSVFLGQQSLFNHYDCGLWSHTYTQALVSDGKIDLKNKPVLNAVELKNKLIGFFTPMADKLKLVSFFDKLKSFFNLSKNKNPTSDVVDVSSVVNEGGSTRQLLQDGQIGSIASGVSGGADELVNIESETSKFNDGDSLSIVSFSSHQSVEEGDKHVEEHGQKYR